ncbi:MAG TPA: hypothetical protein VGO13_00965 [Solirubrobacterales bacterium]|nr:hypothetical protein [Solirubrobacterales bacterium]
MGQFGYGFRGGMEFPRGENGAAGRVYGESADGMSVGAPRGKQCADATAVAGELYETVSPREEEVVFGVEREASPTRGIATEDFTRPAGDEAGCLVELKGARDNTLSIAKKIWNSAERP